MPVSASASFASARVLAPLRFGLNKPVLLSSDLDDTLVRWQGDHGAGGPDRDALDETTRRLLAYRSRLAVHVNTGRGLTSIKHAAPHLASVPIDYLSLNNGQELYVNRNREASDRWIARLTPADRDPRWSAWIARQTGWQPVRVQRVMRAAIEAAGYAPCDAYRFENEQFKSYVTFRRTLPGGQLSLVNWYPDQPVFTISGLRQADGQPPERVYDQAIDQEGRRLMEQVGRALAAQGVRLDAQPLVESYPGAPFRLAVFEPSGINKASVIDALARWHLPKLTAVITAGDHPYNDRDMLLRADFRGKRRLRILSRRTVPNYPILSGNHAGLVNPFAAHPRGVQVPSGRLAPGLDAHLQRLNTLK